MHEILYTTALFLLLAAPLVSLPFSVAAVILPSSKRSLLREEYQLKIIRAAMLFFAFIIGGKVLMLYSTTLNMFMVGKNLSLVFPIIIYAAMINYSSRRLIDMGYNRFIALIATAPLLGPAFILWLFVTIRNKQRMP